MLFRSCTLEGEPLPMEARTTILAANDQAVLQRVREQYLAEPS